MAYLIRLASYDENGGKEEKTLPHMFSDVTVKEIRPDSYAAIELGDEPGIYLELCRTFPCSKACKKCEALVIESDEECVRCGTVICSDSVVGVPKQHCHRPSGVVSVPHDADEIYQMNEDRKTLSIHRWPPRGKEFRS